MIYLYLRISGGSPPEFELHSRLRFHEKGIQALAWANDSKHLISAAVQSEKVLAIWDVDQQLVIKSALIRQSHINAIKVDPYIDDSSI
mmetsp:Transcript_34972/g.26106  ORF Transcript_34972/g.26106 Transcript_34972/m.26106 type:complete len:88 (+) Transcript_34972:399-662(+)